MDFLLATGLLNVGCEKEWPRQNAGILEPPEYINDIGNVSKKEENIKMPLQ